MLNWAMARFTLGLGIFLILAGITVATYVGVKGPKDMATQAQTAIAAVLIVDRACCSP